MELYFIHPKQETDDERRARIYPIILSEYNPAWSEWYTEEKTNLERLIGTENIQISHFGSTAIPGLTAKPTIDILLEISDDAIIDKLIATLSSPDYIYLHQESNPTISTPSLHLMFLKGYLSDAFAKKVYHIHVVRSGDWNERLCFRDYLISHPEAAAEYAELKNQLIKDHKHYRDGYTEAKSEFVNKITKLAMEKNMRKLHRCLHLGFNHGGEPDDDIDCRKLMQTGANYRFDLSRVIVAQNGDYACYAGMWLDGRNRYAYLEPLCTVPEYRRMGLAAYALTDAMKATKQLGAEYCFGGVPEFYTAMGFETVCNRELWKKVW